MTEDIKLRCWAVIISVFTPLWEPSEFRSLAHSSSAPCQELSCVKLVPESHFLTVPMLAMYFCADGDC